MKKVVAVIGFCVILTGLSYGQMSVMTAAGSGNNVLREGSYTSVQGSPYFIQDWKSGAISDKAGKVTENLMIRYDAYRDEVQFLKEGKTLAVDPTLVAGFHFFSLNEKSNTIEKFEFRNGFSVDEFTKLSYFQVVCDRNVKFIRKIKVNYLEELVNNYGTNEQLKKFVKSTYEFIIVNGKVIEVDKNRKNIVSSLDSTDELKGFIKKNSLSLKKDSDLCKVLEKAESMIKLE